MSSKSLLTLCVAAMAVAVASARSAVGTSEMGTMVNYDCSGKVDGDYPHPSRCDYFISCVAQSQAYEMPCAMGNDNQRLHFVQNSGPDKNTSRCDRPEVAKCPIGVTTQAPPTTPGDAEEPCREHECKQSGNCTAFKVCQGGKWTEQNCGDDLFWNPDRNTEHGGVCDFFDNLDQGTKDDYLRDEKCIPACAWWGEGDCSGEYNYREQFQGSLKNREHRLTCPKAPAGSSEEDLVWNQDILNCDRRENVDGCKSPPAAAA